MDSSNNGTVPADKGAVGTIAINSLQFSNKKPSALSSQTLTALDSGIFAQKSPAPTHISLRQRRSHKLRHQRSRRRSAFSLYYSLIRKPRLYQIEKCTGHPIATRIRKLNRLQKTDQLFKLRILPVGHEKDEKIADSKSPSPAVAGDDISDDDAQSASISSGDSEGLSDASLVPSTSTALTTPDMSDSEIKDADADVAPPPKRIKIVIKKATATTTANTAANTMAKMTSPGKPATEIPVVTKALNKNNAAVETNKKVSPNSATSPPTGTKRKRDASVGPAVATAPAVAALKKGSNAFFQTRVQETLTDPLGFDDCVSELPPNKRARALKNQRQFDCFRKVQGPPIPPVLSGALRRPRGSKAVKGENGDNDADSTANLKRPIVMPGAVKKPGEGGIMLGWVPGETRWKKHTYNGPRRSRLSW
ncbi:hypothetical protein B0T16DRAFT_56582 [Cercophora newfieldiana]|uniref:Uncharacterized protein n=1 Tax=Cercophora newfieldiana TaxID=92897 RepID=A0AA40CZJ9_9PEZI|nr:hypothetical protein B0T16DRAFT_56582 [Cercophora newfieldiana]